MMRARRCTIDRSECRNIISRSHAGPEGETVNAKRPGQRLARKVSAKDHVRGSPLASTTLVAYGDFASPACAQAYGTVKKIQKKMGTRLRYVYRSFPQPEQFRHSEEAAQAAECASSQGRFWEMHDPCSKARLRGTGSGSNGMRRRSAWT